VEIWWRRYPPGPVQAPEDDRVAGSASRKLYRRRVDVRGGPRRHGEQDHIRVNEAVQGAARSSKLHRRRFISYRKAVTAIFSTRRRLSADTITLSPDRVKR